MRALIVEDEILASEELNYLIQEHSQIEVVDRLEDGLDVLKFLQEQEVDVIFLDINIPSLDGMMLAHHIGKFATKPYIVFTTAYKEHAAEAFELEAFDYILKPYDEKRIAAMLHKLELAFKRDHAPVEQHVEDGPAPTADGLLRRVNWYENEIRIPIQTEELICCGMTILLLRIRQISTMRKHKRK